jgi:hypothetical protein
MHKHTDNHARAHSHTVASIMGRLYESVLDASIRMNVTEIVDRITPARKPADPTSAYLPHAPAATEPNVC